MNASSPKISYLIAARLYLRGLGLVFFVAFYSFYAQMDGLVGPKGILPLDGFLTQVRQFHPDISFSELPSLSLYFPSWLFFKGLVVSGMIAGITATILPQIWLTHLFLWMAYLTVCVNGQVFMGFQWDNLLLECALLGFLMTFLINIKDSSQKSLNTLIISSIIFRILLFKLMFSSGIVKFSAQDPTWLNKTALDYHFLTQPLPTSLAWHFHHYSSIFHKFLCYFTYFVEIIVPFLYFLSSKYRIFSFISNFILMTGIFLTGNYNFFNILSVILSLFLLDDQTLGTWFSISTSNTSKNHLIKYIIILPIIFTFIILSSIQTLQAAFPNMRTPALLSGLSSKFQPFRSISPYGLFRVMTTQRREICIEGSNTPDKKNSWKEYIFLYKPGPVDRAPVWIQPLQPRLDWQLWFAALSNYEREQWYLNLLVRLLQAEPTVLKLLDHDPFEGKAPKYVRGVFYEYTFGGHAEKERGTWWLRKDLGLYSPPIFLR